MNKESYYQQLAQERANTLATLNRLAQGSVVDNVQAQKQDWLRRKVQRIDAAFQRLATGEYGKCLGCQSTIPQERLHALPYAEYCFRCQRQLENERVPGDDNGNGVARQL